MRELDWRDWLIGIMAVVILCLGMVVALESNARLEAAPTGENGSWIGVQDDMNESRPESRSYDESEASGEICFTYAITAEELEAVAEIAAGRVLDNFLIGGIGDAASGRGADRLGGLHE